MIVCRSRVEIEKLRRVNQLVAQVLAELRQMAVPGVTTADIDRVAEDRVRAAGAEPAFKGYHGYPATVCVSANEQVVHGIPSKRQLVEGDILSIDMGAKLDGFFGDCAVTVPLGRVSPQAAEAARGDRGGALSRHRGCETGRAGIGYRRCRPAARREPRVLCRA
jgi:methionyl aminopeptidase